MPHSMGLLLPLEAAAVLALVLLAVWRRGRRVADPSLDVPERIHDALLSARLPDGAATAIATATQPCCMPWLASRWSR